METLWSEKKEEIQLNKVHKVICPVLLYGHKNKKTHEQIQIYAYLANHEMDFD